MEHFSYLTALYLVLYCPGLTGSVGVWVRSKMLKFGLKYALPQIVFVALMALAWWRVSAPAMFATLLGGAAVILPTFCFSLYFLGKIHTKSPQRVLVAFYVGEFLKIIFSVVTMLIFVTVFKVAILPLITGFMGAHLGTWFTPFFRLKKRAETP